MDIHSLPDNPYLLLTPGPLSTTKTVKAAMLRDWCTWDDDCKMLVQEVRTKLTRLATDRASAFRIGTIGDVYPADMERLLTAIEASMFRRN
jgi:aspartate aminotransferase-like enzyme